MNVTQTIQTFLNFFRDRGHQVIQGASLVPPDGDPVLFTSAGMHPLTPYLEGVPHPRAGDSPACSAACAPPISNRSATTVT
jgi:alanyl-tRNA synthetase